MVEEYVVKQATMPQYGECEYWDERYSREPAAFDWYQGFSGLQSILHQAFPMHATILQVGVGSSRLQEDMAHAGWRHIINVDYSRVVINHMTELHKGVQALEYRVADVRRMPEFADCSFEGVLDKGTLDAILCGEQSTQNAAAMLQECFRVLKPGFPFMLVTYGDPASRLPYLEELSSVDIVVYALTKQEVLEAMDAEPVVRPLIKGPYPASNTDCMDALSGLEGMHFVYLCHKHWDDSPQQDSELPESQQQPEEQPLPPQQQQLGPREPLLGELKKPTLSSTHSGRLPEQLASGVCETRADDSDTGASRAAPERPAAVAPAGL
ncbi:hypothetical protein Vretimale_12887 [Volvox reticuliferus]|uniref:Uncharacterized protein n=1 Tax=Volvox reticuliferus TaxID=1737510 RepID=A0A8J4CC82_9CHLO|nr:hypothetical protein Vretifemale_9254 [Volvox reticuliferus]GIM09002.1 hypothetical protein Vretimale_12887 [Volvox reticuliferus]